MDFQPPGAGNAAAEGDVGVAAAAMQGVESDAAHIITEGGDAAVNVGMEAGGFIPGGEGDGAAVGDPERSVGAVADMQALAGEGGESLAAGDAAAADISGGAGGEAAGARRGGSDAPVAGAAVADKGEIMGEAVQGQSAGGEGAGLAVFAWVAAGKLHQGDAVAVDMRRGAAAAEMDGGGGAGELLDGIRNNQAVGGIGAGVEGHIQGQAAAAGHFADGQTVGVGAVVAMRQRNAAAAADAQLAADDGAGAGNRQHGAGIGEERVAFFGEAQGGIVHKQSARAQFDAGEGFVGGLIAGDGPGASAGFFQIGEAGEIGKFGQVEGIVGIDMFPCRRREFKDGVGAVGIDPAGHEFGARVPLQPVAADAASAPALQFDGDRVGRGRGGQGGGDGDGDDGAALVGVGVDGALAGHRAAGGDVDVAGAGAVGRIAGVDGGAVPGGDAAAGGDVDVGAHRRGEGERPHRIDGMAGGLYVAAGGDVDMAAAGVVGVDGVNVLQGGGAGLLAGVCGDVAGEGDHHAGRADGGVQVEGGGGAVMLGMQAEAGRVGDGEFLPAAGAEGLGDVKGDIGGTGAQKAAGGGLGGAFDAHAAGGRVDGGEFPIAAGDVPGQAEAGVFGHADQQNARNKVAGAAAGAALHIHQGDAGGVEVGDVAAAAQIDGGEAGADDAALDDEPVGAVGAGVEGDIQG